MTISLERIVYIMHVHRLASRHISYLHFGMEVMKRNLYLSVDCWMEIRARTLYLRKETWGFNDRPSE